MLYIAGLTYSKTVRSVLKLTSDGGGRGRRHSLLLEQVFDFIQQLKEFL